MAITKIWPVKSHLGELLKYVGNKNKTSDEWSGPAENCGDGDPEVDPVVMQLIGYDADEYKTEQRLYVTGVNCTPEGAPALMTKLLGTFDNTRGDGYRVAYHAVQSFDSGEVDPATAHAIGVEYANRMWGENFAVVVATHCNTDNVHNHFSICATGFDGKRFHEDGAMRHRMMDENDRLCREFGLSVCPNRDWGHAQRFIENKMEERGQKTYRQRLREDIDYAIVCVGNQSCDTDELYHFLERLGYLVERRGNDLRVRPDEAQRFIRLRSLGAEYTEERIGKRLFAQFWDQREKLPSVPYRRREKAKGLYGLYLHYQYLLGNLPVTHIVDPALAATLREESRKARKYSEEADLLGRNKIDTMDDLEKYFLSCSEQLRELTDARQKLRNKLRRMHDSEEMKPIKEQTHAISNELARLRHQMDLAQDISENSYVTAYISAKFEFDQESQRDPNYAKTHTEPALPDPDSWWMKQRAERIARWEAAKQMTSRYGIRQYRYPEEHKNEQQNGSRTRRWDDWER